jgi:hypothetical protein
MALLDDPRYWQSLGARDPHIDHLAEKPFRVRLQSTVAQTLTLLPRQEGDDRKIDECGLA